MVNKKTNILFICKYNLFRSKVAETYLRKINPSLKISSAGVVPYNINLPKGKQERNKILLEKFNIKIKGNPNGVSAKLLEKQDKIIVISDDIPKEVFNNKLWKDKVNVWKIENEEGSNKQKIEKIVKAIILRVDKLNKELK